MPLLLHFDAKNSLNNLKNIYAYNKSNKYLICYFFLAMTALTTFSISCATSASILSLLV